MADQEYIICIEPLGHAGQHTFVPVGSAFNVYGKCQKPYGGNQLGPQGPLVIASELRELTQCLLAATILLDKGQLDVKAQQMLAAWLKALPALRELTHQFPSSVAAIATRRAIGMLSYPQRARNAASDECAALLTNNEPLRNLLADGEWYSAAEFIAQDVITAYVLSLEGGQL